MTNFELPRTLGKVAGELVGAGFEEVDRHEGTMDSGWIVLARPPVAVSLQRDRSFWLGFELRIDGWGTSPLFPTELGGDPFPPRPSRDPARAYPAEVRWLARNLLADGFADASTDAPGVIRLHRAPVTVEFAEADDGWRGTVIVDAWPPAAAVELTLES